MGKQLKKLRHLTQMILDAERMKLQRIILAEREKADQIKALDSCGKERVARLVKKGGADMALYAGADLRWESWVQKEKKELNIQRAALLAKRDVQRQETRKAFGKDEAVRQLVNKTDQMAQMKLRRS